MATLKADRRLCVTADREEIVEEGDPRAAFLLVAEGLNIGEGDVAKYKLQMKDGRVTWPESKSTPAPENKMAPAPEDKAPAPEPEPDDEIDATEAAIQLADDEDIDLAEVEGTGKDGRILLSDVEAAVEARGE